MKKCRPESLMMSHAYSPEWSEGSIKPPIFQTSTFCFQSAEQGKEYFEVAYGLKEPKPGVANGLIYSRINNPNVEIFENRLSLWDNGEACAAFNSGMAAISTALLEYLRPGDTILHSSPLYGGTDHFINSWLPQIGVKVISFDAYDTAESIMRRIEEQKIGQSLKVIFVETPANPTNEIIDIAMCRRIADRYNPDAKIMVDNTFMGPLWSHPLNHGADLVIYSATKYIAGHSDLIAGAVVGNSQDILRLKTMRTFLGNMPSPNTAWLLTRSLETLQVRMERQLKNAEQVAYYLQDHNMVATVHYLGLIAENDPMYALYKRQYSSPGAMISFEIKGGEKEAFKFLNQLNLIKMAVSLGSTESLAQHPASMTHAGVHPIMKQQMGITDNLIRLSIGIENVNDLIEDIESAFKGMEDELSLKLNEAEMSNPTS